MKGHYFVLDCETGGFEAEKNPITQFACLLLDRDNFKELSRVDFFVKPYHDLVIEQSAIDHTLVSRRDIENGVPLSQAVDTIAALARAFNPGKGKWRGMNAPMIVGHNVAFDIGFLEKAFEFEGKQLSDYFASNNKVTNFIDTLQYSRLAFPSLNSYALGSCCKQAGINLEDAHGAMNDVVSTVELFKSFRSRLSSSNKSSNNENEVVFEDDVRFRDAFKI